LLVIIVILPISSSVLGNPKKSISEVDFKKIPPIVLQTQDGKQYKFDIDILNDAGITTEPSLAVNHQARGDIINLKRGESLAISYDHPFGPNDLVRASLLKGHITAHEGLNEDVKVQGTQFIFLTDYSPNGTSQSQIPQEIRLGYYNLVILITFNEELRGYYITPVIVNR
jgi:hypothetical protein